MTDKNEMIHSRHKQRLRERYLENEGFNGFYDHEILEMLLSYAVVRGDTNETAHRLLNKFGSLSGVFEAKSEELMKVDGVGEKCAAIIKMQYDLFGIYEASKYNIKNEKYTRERLIGYLRGLFFGKTQEYLYLICLDDNGCVIKSKCMASGMGEVKADIREIAAELLATNSRGAILAHNHTNGKPYPSKEDMITTSLIADVLGKLSIKLIDHFVFGGDSFSSVNDAIEMRCTL